MSKPEPKVAILTTRVNPTLTDLHPRIESYSATRRSGVFKDGRPFFIATEDRHLRGKPLIDYEVFRYSDMSIREDNTMAFMIGLAKTRKASTIIM